MDERKANTYLRVIVTINFLKGLNEFPSWLGEVFQSLNHYCSKLYSKGNKHEGYIAITYHSLHIQNSCALINVFFGRDCTRWHFIIVSPLKLLDMVLQITIHGGNLHELGGINQTKSFNIYRPSILVDAMMPLGIVLKDLFFLLEIEVLTNGSWQKHQLFLQL